MQEKLVSSYVVDAAFKAIVGEGKRAVYEEFTDFVKEETLDTMHQLSDAMKDVIDEIWDLNGLCPIDENPILTQAISILDKARSAIKDLIEEYEEEDYRNFKALSGSK